MQNADYIVLGAEHYNPLGVIRSLGEEGILPIAIIINQGTRRLASKSKYIAALHLVHSAEEAISVLINSYGIAHTGKRTFVYVTDDTCLSALDLRYEELKEQFILFNAGKTGRITEFLNKNRIMQLAVKHGLEVLPYQVVKRGEIPQNLTYPIITKAIDSTKFGWKNEMHICKNQEELCAAYESMTSETLILQKYIDKKNEYCLEGFSVNQGKKVFISIASQYKYKLAMSYSPYMDVNNFDRSDLYEKLCGMFEEIQFEGIFEIEFLVNKDNQLFFGEINFRNSTWSYASTCAGMNLPVNWAKYMNCSKFDIRTIYNRIKPGFTAMVEPDDYSNRVRGGQCNLFRWLKDFKTANCKYYIGRYADYGPIVSFAKSYAIKIFKKVFQ